MTRKSARLTSLNEALREIESAADAARVQLHLLAMDTRHAASDVGDRLVALESRLDDGIEGAMKKTADKTRQLVHTLQEFLRGRDPEMRDNPLGVSVTALASRPVYTCNVNEPLSRAAQIMWEADCGAVPVVDNEGRFVGMITDRDLAMSCWLRSAPPAAVPLSTVMTDRVVTCQEDDSVREAAAVMSASRVRRLVVVDAHGRPSGVAALADFARYASRLDGGHQRAGRAMISELLAAVSEPRETRRAALVAAE